MRSSEQNVDIRLSLLGLKKGLYPHNNISHVSPFKMKLPTLGGLIMSFLVIYENPSRKILLSGGSPKEDTVKLVNSSVSSVLEELEVLQDEADTHIVYHATVQCNVTVSLNQRGSRAGSL